MPDREAGMPPIKDAVAKISDSYVRNISVGKFDTENYTGLDDTGRDFYSDYSRGLIDEKKYKGFMDYRGFHPGETWQDYTRKYGAVGQYKRERGKRAYLQDVMHVYDWTTNKAWRISGKPVVGLPTTDGDPLYIDKDGKIQTPARGAVGDPRSIDGPRSAVGDPLSIDGPRSAVGDPVSITADDVNPRAQQAVDAWLMNWQAAQDDIRVYTENLKAGHIRHYEDTPAVNTQAQSKVDDYLKHWKAAKEGTRAYIENMNNSRHKSPVVQNPPTPSPVQTAQKPPPPSTQSAAPTPSPVQTAQKPPQNSHVFHEPPPPQPV